MHSIKSKLKFVLQQELRIKHGIASHFLTLTTEHTEMNYKYQGASIAFPISSYELRVAIYRIVYYIRHHAPYLEIALIAYLNWPVSFVFRDKGCSSIGNLKSFHSEVAIDGGDHDIGISSFQGTVHYQDVAGEDACAGH